MQDYLEITAALLSALAAGSLIGLERSYHGRPAGFRTHALVCLASALLMLVSVYQWRWFVGTPLEAIRTDPTRMAQGIMTGIGFLGAGVIFKEGLTVRGLTTAASIWITATLGVLYGVGFYYPAVLATIATLGVLGGFRWFENRMPAQIFAHLDIRYPRDRVPDVAAFRAMLATSGFSASGIRHCLVDDETYEYRTMIRTTDRTAADRLAAALLLRDEITEFTLEPAGD
jgi:putative Mg2+ transporter-C (MgtC) family protein